MPRITGEDEKGQVNAEYERNAVNSDNTLNGSEKEETLEKGRIDSYLEKFRGTRSGRLTVRITVAILGAAVVGLGLVLVPLPGPGWLIVFGGLAIWSLEFHWAKRLNRYVRRQVSAWTTWYTRQTWPIKLVVGAATGLFVLAVIAGATYLSFGAEAFTWISA